MLLLMALPKRGSQHEEEGTREPHVRRPLWSPGRRICALATRCNNAVDQRQQ